MNTNAPIPSSGDELQISDNRMALSFYMSSYAEARDAKDVSAMRLSLNALEGHIASLRLQDRNALVERVEAEKPQPDGEHKTGVFDGMNYSQKLIRDYYDKEVR